MADPRCPECAVSGSDKIISSPSKEKARDNSPWFFVAHCSECGHVYGVFAKHVFGRGGPQLIVERN